MTTERDSYLDGLLKKIQNLEPENKVYLSEVLSGKLHKFSRSDRCIRQLELLGVVRESHQFACIRTPLLECYIRKNIGGSFSPPVAPVDLITPKLVGGNLLAYETLFELENDIRNFIVSGLYAKYKSKWIDNLPQSEGWNQAKGRHSKHRTDAWEGQGSYPLLAYSFFGDLKEAIKDNWDIFGNYFHPQAKFANYFDRLEEIRNDVAHNRMLSQRNLRELESIRDAFRSCMVVK